MNQSPLDLSVPSVKPINLPEPTSQYDPPAGTHVNVSGWGFTNVINLDLYLGIANNEH